jgi:hypothetical protein
MEPNVIFMWGRQRSGSNWFMRLILKNFKHVVIVIAWKHTVPRCMPGHLRLPLMEGRPPDADELEAVTQQLYAKEHSPAQVFASDDMGFPEPTAIEIHPEIEKAVVGAVAEGAYRHVAIVKHPENWLASIRATWPGGGWSLENWNASAEWVLALRNGHGAALLRWEDLCRDLNHLAILEGLGLERRGSLWLPETRIVGSHGAEPPPDREAFQPRKPAIATPEERALVSPGIMEALGYEWGRPDGT